VLGSVLSVKPIIAVTDGKVEGAAKVRTRSKGVRFLLDKIKESSVEQVAVLEGMADDVDEFVTELRSVVGDAEIIIGRIGPVIGVHSGPGVLCVTWIARG